jgi:hypothetical protein
MSSNEHELCVCTECAYQFQRGMASIRVHADKDGYATRTAVCPACLSPKYEKLNDEKGK